jgi:hypothetical protein
MTLAPANLILKTVRETGVASELVPRGSRLQATTPIPKRAKEKTIANCANRINFAYLICPFDATQTMAPPVNSSARKTLPDLALLGAMLDCELLEPGTACNHKPGDHRMRAVLPPIELRAQHE